MEQPPLETGNEAEARLLRSALHLFAEQGYEGASIREIIEGAGVTRPVLYYYFRNKEDLFRRLVEPLFAELLVRLQEITQYSATTRERLKAVMSITFDVAERNPRAGQLILQMYFSPPVSGPQIDKEQFRRKRFQVVQEIIQQGLLTGEITGGDALSLSSVFVGLVDTQIMAKSHMANLCLNDELADNLMGLFFHGIHYTPNPFFSLTAPAANAPLFRDVSA